MTIVNVLEAKTNLSRLIAEVEAGGEVIIARANKPVVRLVAVAPADRRRREPGRLKGIVQWDDRFDDPLPADELALWNGEGE